MPIPNRKELRLPFLQVLSDGEWHTHDEMLEYFAEMYQVTPEERSQKHPNNQGVYDNRVHGVRADFARWCLIKYDRERNDDYFRLSEYGKLVWKMQPKDITRKIVEEAVGDDYLCW